MKTLKLLYDIIKLITKNAKLEQQNVENWYLKFLVELAL